MIRSSRTVKVGLGVVVLAGAIWGVVTVTRPSLTDVMPTVSNADRTAWSTSATGDVSTTTGMSAVDIVSVRLGENRKDLILNLAACNAARNAVDVAEDETRVLLHARTVGGSDAVCSDGLTVSLARELGQRMVVDANRNQTMRVETE